MTYFILSYYFFVKNKFLTFLTLEDLHVFYQTLKRAATYLCYFVIPQSQTITGPGNI